MKIKKFVYFIIANFSIINSVFADGFSAQNGSPTITHSLALQQYVHTISSYQPETLALKNRLHNIISYYQKVHILKTINKKNYTIDCIPFAEQPSLIDKPVFAQTLIPTMISTTQENWDHLKKIGSHFDFNPTTECPFGSVAILRPSKTILTHELANKKIAPPRKVPADCTSTQNYSWEQGYTPDNIKIEFPTQANQAYFKGPQNQHIKENPSDHSLDQFWYSNSLAGLDYTVEFGIISSAYFTQPQAITIFVFASVDGYGPNSCYDLLCPNFIQAPGSPPLGVPITNLAADYIFKVTHTSRPGFQPGSYLTLETHSSDNQADANALLGYYPNSLYPAGALPVLFSAGAEVYAVTPGNGTIMYGNYSNPIAGYTGPKQIELFTCNNNDFPFSTSMGPAPYGLIWNFGH